MEKLLLLISNSYRECKKYGEPSLLIFQSDDRILTMRVLFKERKISSIEVMVNNTPFIWDYPTTKEIAKVENLLSKYCNLGKLELIGCNYGTFRYEIS